MLRAIDVKLATTVAAPSTTTTAATTAWTILSRPSFVHRQWATVVLFFIEAFDRGPSRVIVRHFDESETLASARVAILNHLRAAHRAELCKQFFQIGIRHFIREIANIQLLAHTYTPIEKAATFGIPGRSERLKWRPAKQARRKRVRAKASRRLNCGH